MFLFKVCIRVAVPALRRLECQVGIANYWHNP
jgi:hypothetical protein